MWWRRVDLNLHRKKENPMAEDNARPAEESGALEVERKLDRQSRPRDQRGAVKVKDKPEDTRLPTPPPDPQCLPVARDHTGETSRGPEEEEEDLATYLGELSTSPFEGHSFDYDTTPNSRTSAMGGDAAPFTEEAFEHLDRLCALTEQILELRDRSSKFFRRVRGLERVKVQRNADRRLEVALANDEEELLRDFTDEDTGFAESLLDAMLSNCRDASSTPRRSERLSVRSPSSSRQRSRSLALAEQNLVSNLVETADKRGSSVRNTIPRNGGPKVSKWTRVKAAFKWERACTNDLADIAESCTSVTASSTPTTKYLRIPDTITTASWSAGATLSSCTSEVSSPSTPIGRVSPASSSNEEVFDDSRKNIINYPDRQLPLLKDDRKKDDPDRHIRSLDRDTPVIDSVGSVESPSEVNRNKPLIRIISDADATIQVSGGGRDPEVSPKRPTPILTITIPSNEEEIRNLSSPESISPLPSSTQDSGGSSPQHPKMRQDSSSPREFKRQHSTIEEAVTQAPKIQRQDSKWNKVRRAFLTNATFSVPPSPVRMVPPQSFTNDDTRRARSCSESVEDLGKTVTGISSNHNNINNNNNNHCREQETRKDYQALREKFGAEFHRKLVEWERLKSARNARDGLPLNEERLAPEFRKKLQEWKRTKKGRRSGATIEQQRVSRRRLTDWQLWRSSSSKPELRSYNKNQNSIGSRGSCASIGSGGSFGSDGKQYLCEDFIKRMEAWRRMSEAACRNERPRSPMNRVTSDIIDETEFITLEKLLVLFGQRIGKERRESDARQLNDCFDGDSRFTAMSRGINCGNEVLIRTSVGSYRFEGISREFTRKLYDWEKYRGISPRSSTFRLLGPGYTPFSQDLDEATLTESSSKTGKNRAFHWTLKRSKSDGSIFEGNLRDESFTVRRSTSLQSLISTNKLEDDTRMNALPVSNNSQGIKDPSEDTAVEDSEPEAMIVDIEDVIEETASPLTGVQPHQTPVYSVAASETTSIAVPLGTVTSSHEPSPVFLVEAEDNENCEPWNRRKWIGPETRSSENSPSPERCSLSKNWCKREMLLDEDKSSWEPRERDNKEDRRSVDWTKKTRCPILDFGDSVKSDQSIEWNQDTWDETCEETNRDSIAFELPLTPIYESRNDTKKQEPSFENDDPESAYFENDFETTSTTWNEEELTDSPRTWTKETNKTRKIEDLADESSNNEQTSDMEDLQDNRNDQKAKKEKIILSTDFCTYQLARTISPSDHRDSTETFSTLSNSNLDDNKNTSESCLNIENETSAHYENCSSPELQTDVDRHYEILTFKADTCGNTMNNHLYEPVDCDKEIRGSFYNNRNNCVKENLLSSKLTTMERSNLSETPKCLLSNSTVRTVPITVSRGSEARCLEKILINEETLNKIIVPTSSSENGMKSAERIRNRFASVDRPDGVVENRSSDCNSSMKTATHDSQIDCVKKDGSSSRNVFIKSKRMIFGPFRRSEDRTSSRKESDGSIDSRLQRSSKSKSKSRSASPKLCRQDALLRVSLSLPWPLRSTSKESESPFEAESRRNSGSKAEDVVTVQQKSLLCEENSVKNNKRFNDRLTEEKSPINVNREKLHHSDGKIMTAPINMCSFGMTSTRVSERSDQSRITSIEQDQCGQTQKNEVKCNQVNFQRKRDEEKFSQKQERKQEEFKFGQRQHEAKQQDENHAKCDAISSDLMHKLRILSDAAERKEGRSTVTESPITGDPESRSSKIRRAKESFLSRRGGPFCHSMMELTETADPWRRSTVTSTQTLTETSKENEIAMITTKSGETEDTENKTKMASLIAQDEVASLCEDRTDAGQQKDLAIDADVRAESLVKSASVGMINVDPNTFDRLATTDRGCESLPRTIAKRSSGPLAKIVSKLRLSRLIRAKNVDGSGMSTISTLCRQSLLINMSRDPENRPSNERESEKDSVARDKDKDDDNSSESS